MLKIETIFAKRREIAKQRLEHCHSCEEYESDIGRCKLCGCFMEFKAVFPDSQCPLHKWENYKDGEKENVHI